MAYLEMALCLSVAKIEAESQKDHKHIWCLPHTSSLCGVLTSFLFACSGLAISGPLIPTPVTQADALQTGPPLVVLPDISDRMFMIDCQS